MKLIIAAGLGSFIGGASRYLVSLVLQPKNHTGFPYATLTVNLAGCFLIGLLYAIAQKNSLDEVWKVFLVTGILGGFTTFSAFSIETVQLLRSGELLMATLYILLSVIAGLALSALAFKIFA